MFRIATAFELVVLFAACAFPQDYRGTITGQVTDASGGAIPGAKVKATQEDTGDVRETITNHDGYYVLASLTPGVYNLEARAGGFNTMDRLGVAVLTAEKIDIPFSLAVGSVTEQVTVTAQSDVLQTTDASGGLNFD